jgi:hypothetical protein
MDTERKILGATEQNNQEEIMKKETLEEEWGGGRKRNGREEKEGEMLCGFRMTYYGFITTPPSI